MKWVSQEWPKPLFTPMLILMEISPVPSPTTWPVKTFSHGSYASPEITVHAVQDQQYSTSTSVSVSCCNSQFNLLNKFWKTKPRKFTSWTFIGFMTMTVMYKLTIRPGSSPLFPTYLSMAKIWPHPLRFVCVWYFFYQDYFLDILDTKR